MENGEYHSVEPIKYLNKSLILFLCLIHLFEEKKESKIKRALSACG